MRYMYYYTSYSGLMTYSADELQKATNNFAVANCLGKGGFGEVYHAELRCSDVAVKSANKKSIL